MRKTLLLALVAFGTLLAACGGGDGGSGAVCPTANAPTYETFGKTFFDTYCISCHASSRTGAQRGGAPAGRDYDTLAGIRKELADIDAESAAGPDATNTAMPPGIPRPSDDDRKKLGEFLACEKAK